MRSLTKVALCFLVVSLCFQYGCMPRQPVFLGEKKGNWQSQFIGKATQIEIPNVNVPSLSAVCHAAPPLTLINPHPETMWDLTLEEAIHTTLRNSQVIRTLGGAAVPGALLQGGGQARTVFDPALIESDPRIGQEAALAAFDAQLRAGTRWNRTNNPGQATWGQVPPGAQHPTLGELSDGAMNRLRDTGTFHMGISKYTAPGTQFFFNHENTIEGYRDFPTWHTSSLSGGFVHPLLRGGGIEYNRIAGPHGSPGVYGGVAIARIHTDMALTDFEMSVRNLVSDVERAYWNLYFAYHRLEAVRTGREAAHETWRQTQVRAEIGDRRGSPQNLAQSQQHYFEFRRQTELAQNNLFRAESALRYIMGLPPMDGRLIRPVDDLITAPIAMNWHDVLCEALFRSPELRRQKWAVKQRELEHRASRNFLLPRLDLEGGYHISGGDVNWMGRNSAYSAMGDGNSGGWLFPGGHTGWLGLTASMPLGFRQELAAVRNAEMQLTRSRAILRESELELTHQLGDSFREISLTYQLMKTTLSSFRAATQEVEAVQTAFDLDTTTLDRLLDAQRRRSEAETAYYSSVIDYNLAIMMLHYRKGSLLEFNNICLVEGGWSHKAYADARRRARERAAGHHFNFGFTLPGVVSRGVMRQQQGHGFNSTSFDVLPAAPSREQAPPLAPPAPVTIDGAGMIEPDASASIQTLVLPASFSTSQAVTPPSPVSRNMRYVQ